MIFFPRSLGEDSSSRPYSTETRSHYPSLASRESYGTNRRHQKVPFINMGNMTSTQAHIDRHSEISKLFGTNSGQLGKTQIIAKDTSMPSQNFEDHRISFSPLPTPSYPAKTFSEEDYSLRDSIDYESQWSISESDDKQFGGINYERPEYSEYRLLSDIEMRLMELRLIEIGQIIGRGIHQSTRPLRLHPYVRATHTLL